MDCLLAYLLTGVALSWAADSFNPIPVWQRLAIVVAWLPVVILMGIFARKER